VIPALLGVGIFGLARANASGPFCHGFRGHHGPASAQEVAEHLDDKLEHLYDEVDATPAQRKQISAETAKLAPEIFALMSEGRELRGQLKGIKEKGFWNLSWLGGKTTYTAEKWADPQEGDRRRLEDFYLNRGYVTATIGEPRIEYVQGKTGKKPTKLIQLVIPVNEGDQYRIGEVKFEGLTVFKEEGIRGLFKLQKGDIYKESRIQKGSVVVDGSTAPLMKYVTAH
jgi:outer membrane protein insertion porin family